MKVLLVEDNEILAKGLIYSLEQKNYNVVHTTKVKETEELIKYVEETNETPVVEKSEEVEATEAEAPVEAEN